jgi:hypothetical protein
MPPTLTIDPDHQYSTYTMDIITECGEPLQWVLDTNHLDKPIWTALGYHCVHCLTEVDGYLQPDDKLNLAGAPVSPLIILKRGAETYRQYPNHVIAVTDVSNRHFVAKVEI